MKEHIKSKSQLLLAIPRITINCYLQFKGDIVYRVDALIRKCKYTIVNKTRSFQLGVPHPKKSLLIMVRTWGFDIMYNYGDLTI